MDGITNHLDDFNALRDEDPDGGESNNDVAAHLQLSFDRTFAPFSLQVGHQILKFPFCLCFITNLNKGKSIIAERRKGTFLISMAFSKTPRSSMNSSVTPLEISSPAIVSIAVQCLEDGISKDQLDNHQEKPWFQLWGA